MPGGSDGEPEREARQRAPPDSRAKEPEGEGSVPRPVDFRAAGVADAAITSAREGSEAAHPGLAPARTGGLLRTR